MTGDVRATLAPRAWGFACPQEGLNDEVLNLIVADHARQVVHLLTEKYADSLSKSAPSAAGLLRRWCAGDTTYETVWTPVFGDAHAALVAEEEDPGRLAASLALRLGECGVPGEWEASFGAPAALHVGRWLLPEATAMRVSGDRDTMLVDLSTPEGQRKVELAHDAHGWTTDVPLPSFPPLEHSGLEANVADARILSPGAAARLLHGDAYDFDPSESEVKPQWLSALEDAVGLLEAATPDYLRWVRTVLRTVVPLRARPGTFNSGSERFTPGVICLSDQAYRWPLAEMLVHESTHQYLNIICRLGPLDDGSDERLYFSPFRSKDRPIYFIVVAYHAFANVLLFYREARRNGQLPAAMPDSEAFRDREGTLARQLAAIEPVLDNAPSLTPFGSALWEPLRDRVHADDI